MATPGDMVAIPHRAAGVTPAGPLQGGGFAEQPWLVRRGDRFIQVSELLYQVLVLVDGHRSLRQIADELTETTEWEVGDDDVAVLIERKLAPLGLAGTEVTPVTRPVRRTSILQVNARLRVLGPGAVDSVARVAQHLFRPAVLSVALIVVALAHGWLFLAGRPGAAMQDIAARPLAIPVILALLLGSGAIHEFGHAAALRYGGARARSIGVGWYLVVPIFYTDVTESYRLSRRARIRTDLGGVYFHLLAGVALLGGYALTGDELFLVAVLLIDLDVARQLIPFVRLDGYWLLSDLTGIPDLFTHAAPRLLRRLGGRGAEAAPPPLRRGVRRIFAAYIALTIPIIVALFAYVAWHAPVAVGNAATAVGERTDVLNAAVRDGHVGTALAALTEMLLFVLPALGVVGLVLLLAQSAVMLSRRRSSRQEDTTDSPYGEPVEAAGETISLADAVAEHLELKRRHALEDGEHVALRDEPVSPGAEAMAGSRA